MENFSLYSKEALEIACRALTKQVSRLEKELKFTKDVLQCVESFEMSPEEASRLVRRNNGSGLV